MKKSTEPRKNFIFFMMGYITFSINVNKMTNPEIMRIMTIEMLNGFLKDNNMPQLSFDEENYFKQYNTWIETLYKKHLQKNGLEE